MHEQGKSKGGKGLRKKLGPLEVWQYLSIGTGIGLMIYLYKKGGSSEAKKTEEGNLAEELAKLGGGVGGGVGGGGGGQLEAPIAATKTETGVAGAPGPAGEPGAPGPAGAQPAASLESEVAQLSARVGEIQTKAGAPHKAASAQFKTNTQVGSSRYGQKYQTVTNSKGQVVHKYKDGAEVVIGSKTKKDREEEHTRHAANKGVNPTPKRRANTNKHTAPVQHKKPVPLKQRVSPAKVVSHATPRAAPSTGGGAVHVVYQQPAKPAPAVKLGNFEKPAAKKKK